MSVLNELSPSAFSPLACSPWDAKPGIENGNQNHRQGVSNSPGMMPPYVEPCRRLLVDNKLEALKREQTIVMVVDTATVEESLTVLSENRILSAPVVVPDDAATVDGPLASGSTAADVVGFVDVRDVLVAFLKVVNVEQLAGMTLLQRMRVLENAGRSFATQSLRDLSDIGSDGDFLHERQARTSLLELIMYVLLDPKRRGLHGGQGMTHVIHRIALFDNDGRITHVVSQTDVVRFLLQHADELGSLATMTADELGWVGSKSVVCVAPQTSAIEAMALMERHRVSSVAVISPTGALIGNFSCSEMRTIMSEQFGALALPVGEFLAQEHHTEFVWCYNRVLDEGVVGSPGHQFVVDRLRRIRPHTPGEEVGQELVVAKPSSTLTELMGLLVNHRVHRVYIVDDKLVPVGIITCTDVLRKVVQVAEH